MNQQKLKEFLDYNPETGNFYWKVNKANNTKIGQIAGCIKNNGYVYIRINWKSYLAHRLAFFYVNGRWPLDQIDHINHNRSDNRIVNLRECNSSQNQHNRKNSKGYSWHKGRKKYQAHIKINKISIYLGQFDTAEEARDCYLKAKCEYHER